MSYQLLIQDNVYLNYFFINLTRLFPADSSRLKVVVYFAQKYSRTLHVSENLKRHTMMIVIIIKVTHRDVYCYQDELNR